MRVNLTDAFLLDKKSARRLTDEGHLVAPGVVARTGIYNYGSKELGKPGENRIIKAYRPPEEVFAQDSIASLEGKTVVYTHPQKDVDAANWKQVAVGDCHGIRKLSDSELGAERIYVRDARAISALNTDSELSCGYSARLDWTPGVTAQGEAYDVVVRDLRYNHLAIVPEGRGGPGVKLADQGTSFMKTIMVDGLPFEFDEKVAPVVEKVLKDREDARAALADAKDASAKLADAHSKELESARKGASPETVRAVVGDVFAALADARKLDPEFKSDALEGSTIRREALAAIKDAGLSALRDAFLGDVSKAADSDVSRCLSALAVAHKQAEQPRDRVADRMFGAALSGGSVDANDTIRDATPADIEALTKGAH